MIGVGCTYGPNDLTPETWTELIVLAQERNWMEKKVYDQKHKKGASDLAPDQEKKIAEQRKMTGVPPPGASLFPKGR